MQGKPYINICGELELKISPQKLGAGVTEFIYPNENQKDYDDIMEKYKDKDYFDNITSNPHCYKNRRGIKTCFCIINFLIY